MKKFIFLMIILFITSLNFINFKITVIKKTEESDKTKNKTVITVYPNMFNDISEHIKQTTNYN